MAPQGSTTVATLISAHHRCTGLRQVAATAVPSCGALLRWAFIREAWTERRGGTSEGADSHHPQEESHGWVGTAATDGVVAGSLKRADAEPLVTSESRARLSGCCCSWHGDRNSDVSSCRAAAVRASMLFLGAGRRNHNQRGTRHY